MISKFFLKIALIKIFSCLLAVFIFSRFVQLGDSENYINATLDFSFERLVDRTFFTENFYAAMAMILGRGIQLHIITALIASFIIYKVYRSYSPHIPWSFWLLLLMPSYAVWTSVVGKEILSFCAFLVISKWIADVVIYGRGNNFLLLVAIVFGAILRPHYLLAYLFPVLMVFIFLHKKELKISSSVRFSSGLYFLSMIAFSIITIITVHTFRTLWEPVLFEIMKTSESYFLSYDGNSNRTWILWETYSDFIMNMGWGIPTSLIGPTLGEVIKRPLFVPFFIEGVFSLILIFYFMLLLINTSQNNFRVRFFFYMTFVPALIIALIIHYPFGIFNPGSAIRYKQSLTPLFYFLPLLIIMANRKSMSVELN